MMAGVNMVHVPYRGEALALPDLISGQVQLLFGVMPASLGYIRAGKLRALAVTTSKRQEPLPDVPTVPNMKKRLTTWELRCLRDPPPTLESSSPTVIKFAGIKAQ